MDNKNDKEFERMLESTDEWGEIPNPSLLEDIEEELEGEADISPYDLLTKEEDGKRNLQAGFWAAFGFILPWVTAQGGSRPLAKTSLLVGSIITILTGFSYARSKVYWNQEMPMSYETQQRRTIMNGAIITVLGGIELVIAVIILTVGL